VLIDNNDIKKFALSVNVGKRQLGSQNNNLSIIRLHIAKQHRMWYHTSRISGDTEIGTVQSAALKWERETVKKLKRWNQHSIIENGERVCSF
jgi:hypothetical protein